MARLRRVSRLEWRLHNRWVANTDAVVEAYKRSIDRTLLRENLRRTPQERLRQLQDLQRFAEELRQAGEAVRAKKRR